MFELFSFFRMSRHSSFRIAFPATLLFCSLIFAALAAWPHPGRADTPQAAEKPNASTAPAQSTPPRATPAKPQTVSPPEAAGDAADKALQAPALLPDFGMADVEAKARSLASTAFENPDGKVPAFLLDISYDQWRKIRFRPQSSLWRDEGPQFEAQFFHPGLFYNRLVAINIVDDGKAEKLAFSPDMFEYGDTALADRVRETPLDFSGFRLHFPIKRGDYKDEIAVFLGATYFRAVTSHSQYGLSGRGLAIDTALAGGEEFPYFREFWLVKPENEAQTMTVYALMDTPSMTGAYRFDITPGDFTVMEVACTLFARKGAKPVQKIGLGALTSMFLFGETENGRSGDYRPEVHDSDGLIFLDADHNWFWSPLANPRRLAINEFRLNNPRGFGLMQRDPLFDHYQDLEARYEMRPSLWVEPKGDWGDGRLELIEIPSEEEIHDNMVAFWVPDKTADTGEVPEGQNAAPKIYPETMSYAYRLVWMAPGANPHGLGWAVATRTARQDDKLRFVIDFEGGELDFLPADTGLSSVVEIPDSVQLIEKQLIKNPITEGWRLVFLVRLPKEDGVLQSIRSAREGAPSLRFKAVLKKGENLPDPLTETWIYDLQL